MGRTPKKTIAILVTHSQMKQAASLLCFAGHRTMSKTVQTLSELTMTLSSKQRTSSGSSKESDIKSLNENHSLKSRRSEEGGFRKFRLRSSTLPNSKTTFT
jgi:hypothetical protein